MNVETAGSSLDAAASFHRRGTAGNFFLFCREKPLGALAAALLLVMVLAAAVAETLATHDRIRTDAEHTLARPDRIHRSGTDNPGRERYIPKMYGARVSLVVGIPSTLLGAVCAGVIALVPGYIGGWWD